MSKNTDLVVATISGLCIGTAFSILYAPQSGGVSRAKIRKGANKLSRKLSNATTALVGSAENEIIEVTEGFDYLVEWSLSNKMHTIEEIIKIIETKLLELRLGIRDVEHDTNVPSVNEPVI